MTKVIPFVLLFLFINGLLQIPITSVFSTDLVADSWNTKTPMTHERSGVSVVVVDGKIYAIGGYYTTREELPYYPYYDETTQVFGTNERYDPISDTWTTLEPMPTNRTDFVTAEVSGKIYCIGEGPTEVYDPTTNKWSTKNSIPSYAILNSRSLKGHVIDEKVYVTVYDTDLYMYDPINDSWTQKASVPSPYTGDTGNTGNNNNFYTSVSVVVDDKIVFIGAAEPGYYPDNNDPYQMKVTVYDPKTDSWSEWKNGPKLPYRSGFRAAGATTGIYAPKNIYILGWKYVSNDSPTLPFTWVYDPVKDTWSTAKAPSIRDYHCVVNDDILYLISGTINEQYIPIGYHDATSNPETANSNPSEQFLTYPIITAAVILTVSTVIVGSLVYFVFRKNLRKQVD